MDFSEALGMARVGYKIARDGWNGKNMCVFYTEGSKVPFTKMREETQAALLIDHSMEISEAQLSGTDLEITINPHLDLVCADGSITCGWVASQTDMLAKDWKVVN